MAADPSLDMMLLFLKYLEGKMVGEVSPDTLCGPEVLDGPEVGEGGPLDHALLYRGGVVSIIPATEADLTARGLTPYSQVHLTTEHALVVTRALAAHHAAAVLAQLTSTNTTQTKSSSDTICESTHTAGEGSKDGALNDEEDLEEEVPAVTPGCLKDRWTGQVSQLPIVEANLSILVEALTQQGGSQRTVRRLEALRSDLPTLTQFLQFASAMQTCRIPSMGPLHAQDIWVPREEQEEEVVALRLRGGPGLDAPPLRDAAWVWLTLLGGETLRERYMELCDEYCNAFNRALLRLEATTLVEEMTYFDVMRDLGENFLHAFITVLHKFVVSGTWFFDRQLHTQPGMDALVDVISFLVDNGIVGSIFVI